VKKDQGGSGMAKHWSQKQVKEEKDLVEKQGGTASTRKDG